MQQQREDLYTQVKNASQQQAQTNYQTGLNSLRQQLQQQRLNMNQSRGQIAEQSAMQQRQIQNQMASRGLGNSGLRDLAGLQSQMAAGGAINQLEQQNGLVQQEAINTRRSLSNELTQNLRAADLTHADQMVQSDEKTYQQQEQAKQYVQSTVLELARMAESGASETDVKTWAKLMGLDMDSLDESTLESLSNIGAGKKDEIAELTGVDVNSVAEFGATTGRGVALGTAFLGALAIAAGIAAVPFTGGISLGLVGAGAAGVTAGTTGAVAMGNVWRTSPKNKDGSSGINYQLGGNTINTTSREDAENKITDYYAGKYSEVGSGLIKIEVARNADVKFVYNGTKYNTFGEARTALRSAPR